MGDNQKELSFSDHTHSLPDLDGILTADKGGTGVSSLDELKIALNLQSNDYIMKFQVADYWYFSEYKIQVSTDVFGGIWFNDGISILIKMHTPDQSDYYCYLVTPNSVSTTKLTELTTRGNSYLLSGIYGIFWYPV